MSRRFDEPIHCVIQVVGHLEPHLSDWFLGLEIKHLRDGTTILGGELPDQAALQSVLARIHNLGLSLISVEVKG
jgi:hypothetical protein